MLAEAARVSDDTAFGVANSFTGRRWILRGGAVEAAQGLAQKANISSSLAQLLIARGVTVGDVSDYLNPTLRRYLPEPLLFKDMQRAISRVQAALERGEQIAVFGDYDVDGSCSSAMLCEFFASLGTAARLYVPDRLTEGYGPSSTAMRKLSEEGASLVITVDCGANAIEALQAARDCGLDVIVLDHHAVENAPPSLAHVNPNQSDDASGHSHLCAAGVAFVFLVGLNRALRDQGVYARKGVNEPDLRQMLDLVALATVCDVVPLAGINRAFVALGLSWLSRLARPGLAALAAVAQVTPPFTPHHLGFVLGPRINAGGRVGKCSLGAELLHAREPERAKEIATLLDLHNRERQEVEKRILSEAVEMAALQANAAFVLAAGEGWHAGVVGIVAGRLKEKFHKPAFVVGFEGGMGRGSARSMVGSDAGALVRLAQQEKIIDAGGGHPMAAGFTLRHSQLEGFRAFLVEQFLQSGAPFHSRALEIDMVASPRAATPALVEDIARAGPFGAGNPEPLTVVPEARVLFAETVGQEHVRFRLEGGDGARLDAIAFRSAGQPLGKALLGARGQYIHAVGHLRCDVWQERKRIQLRIEDAAAVG